MIFFALTFFPLVAMLDYLSGRPHGQKWNYILPVVITGVGWAATSSWLSGILLGAAAGIWRDLPWRMFGGHLDPRTRREIRGLTLRLALPWTIATSVASPMLLLAPILAYRWAGKAHDYWAFGGTDAGWEAVEARRGAEFGAAFAISTIVHHFIFST